MKKSETIKGNNNCTHKWVKRDKIHFDILERACTECGQVELHTECEELTEEETKKLFKRGK